MWMRGSKKIKIDLLRVDYTSSKVPFDRLCDLLNELYEQGFYQRLHIVLCHFNSTEDFRKPLHALEALFGYVSATGILPCLSNLKELDISVHDGDDMQTIATHLPNLHRISIRLARFDQILPFIHRCTKLRQMRIIVLGNDEVFFKEDVINLPALNKEREKSKNARKMTIYINERIFLSNKWKQNINLNLIKLKRKQSWKESHPSI